MSKPMDIASFEEELFTPDSQQTPETPEGVEGTDEELEELVEEQTAAESDLTKITLAKQAYSKYVVGTESFSGDMEDNLTSAEGLAVAKTFKTFAKVVGSIVFGMEKFVRENGKFEQTAVSDKETKYNVSVPTKPIKIKEFIGSVETAGNEILKVIEEMTRIRPNQFTEADGVKIVKLVDGLKLRGLDDDSVKSMGKEFAKEQLTYSEVTSRFGISSFRDINDMTMKKLYPIVAKLDKAFVKFDRDANTSGYSKEYSETWGKVVTAWLAVYYGMKTASTIARKSYKACRPFIINASHSK